MEETEDEPGGVSSQVTPRTFKWVRAKYGAKIVTEKLRNDQL